MPSPLFAVADIQARMSDQNFRRLYAKSGGATVDNAYVDLIIAEADSNVRMITAAAFPAGFDAPGGTVDPAIIGACVDIANEIAASRGPASTENGGYFLAGKRARTFFEALDKDRFKRPVTSAANLPQPQSSVSNITECDGVTPNNPFDRAASGSDRSGF